MASRIDLDLRERAAATTPGGVHSNVRLSGPQVFVDRAKGAWLWDVDGKDYVDYLLGQGPNFLGHAPDFVIDAVSESCRNGIIFAGQHELELEAAELVLDLLSWPEMIRFAVTGTEAVQSVLRLARAHTNRPFIVRFEGQYHGWVDNVLLAPGGVRGEPASSGQLTGDLSNMLVLPWNSEDAVSQAFEEYGHQIAGVITEPAMLNAGAISPLPGYLEHLKDVCRANGSLLIFDEVITGFRLAAGGGAERFGVTPDLAAYGKAIASGFPVAAFAGRADVMERLATDTNHSGTLNGNVMGSAAVLATMNHLRREPPYATIAEHGRKLMTEIPKIASEHGHQMSAHGFPMAFHLGFGRAKVTDWRSLQNLDLDQYSRFSSRLVDHGVWVTSRGVWYTSSAHRAAELEAALHRFTEAISGWNAFEE